MKTLVYLLVTLTFCACNNRDNSVAQPQGVDSNQHYSVGRVTFSVPKVWRRATTNTPATRLFLHIPDGKGGASAMIKVDVGQPTLPSLEATVQMMENRFQGTSETLNDGVFILTTTASASSQLPRYIYTALIDGKVYFVFISADDVATADTANKVICSTISVTK